MLFVQRVYNLKVYYYLDLPCLPCFMNTFKLTHNLTAVLSAVCRRNV